MGKSKEVNGSGWLRLCPGCGRKQPPFLYDKGAELCMGCVDESKVKPKSKKLTREKDDAIVGSVEKTRKRRSKKQVLEVGELDQSKAIRRKMEEQLNEREAG